MSTASRHSADASGMDLQNAVLLVARVLVAGRLPTAVLALGSRQGMWPRDRLGE
jgi:hypothetical protein